VVALACLAMLPLALMPGYFSHDELQWAVAAETLRHVPWIADQATFQHRPLTFNLWMALSRALFDTPRLFHAVLVAWGALNAGLLAAIGRRFGMSPWSAAIGALVFVLTPYAVYVHGWIGTIADLIWLTCTLAIAWLALRPAPPPATAGEGREGVRLRLRLRLPLLLLAFALCTTGLLAKEAMVAAPALFAVAWLLDRARRRAWAAAAIGASLAVIAFLAWRAPALLHAPRDSTQYVPSFANVPLRWIEYQLFTPAIGRMEAQTVFLRGFAWPARIALVLFVGVVAAAWRADRRIALAFLLGGFAALAPVLVLGASANHYAYGYAAVGAMTLAAAWARTATWGRWFLGIFAALAVAHGIVVMGAMFEVARVQSVFSPALAKAVARDGEVTLRLGEGARPWMFERLTHEIPAYDGVPIGDRVRIIDGDADYVVMPDGALVGEKR
jgi:hypothetical protein